MLGIDCFQLCVFFANSVAVNSYMDLHSSCKPNGTCCWLCDSQHKIYTTANTVNVYLA